MPELKLVRRWGSHQPGETVDVDDLQGQWLVDTAFAVRPGDEGRNRHGGSGVVHPGTDGPDPRAGGDPSRLRMTAGVKSPREGERAGRVSGAPRAAGDVTHVKPENLGGLNKDNPGDVPLASGKLLSEELAEQQEAVEARDARKQSDAGKQQRAKAESKDGASSETPDEGRKLTQNKK